MGEGEGGCACALRWGRGKEMAENDNEVGKYGHGYKLSSLWRGIEGRRKDISFGHASCSSSHYKDVEQSLASQSMRIFPLATRNTT